MLEDQQVCTTEEAKPCPFCGHQPERQPWHGGGPDKTMVSCVAGICQVSPGVTGESPEEALRTWNARDRRELEDAGMSIRRLLRVVAKHEPGARIIVQMRDWLKRKGLEGSVLR